MNEAAIRKIPVFAKRGFGRLPIAVIAGLITVLLLPSALPLDPYGVDMANRLQPPGGEHWLGTDQLGRDMLARLWLGGQTTVGTALAGLLLSLTIGVPLGLLSGYIGGWFDRLFKRVVDAFMTLPDAIFAIVLTGLLGPGWVNILIALTAVKWVGYARLVRSTVLAEKRKDYVASAVISGLSPFRLVMKHFLPHTIGHVLVLATLDLGKMILMIASLSYIGLGPQPPTPEWGAMLNEGRPFFHTAPHLMLFPGIATVLVVLAVNWSGDVLRDKYDVKNRKGD